MKEVFAIIAAFVFVATAILVASFCAATSLFSEGPTLSLVKSEWTCRAEHVERRVMIVGKSILPREDTVCDRYDRVKP